MTVTYGTGTPTQFTDSSARQILELGKEILYFNVNITPLLSVYGRGRKIVTPVPIFEWMEDEYMIKKSIVLDVDSSGTEIVNSATTGVNDTGSIIILNRQAQMEAFEVGAVYTLAATGGCSLNGMTQALCIAIGKNVDVASPTDKHVQFIFSDGNSETTFTYDETASTVATLSQATTSGTITFTYVGNLQAIGGIDPWAVTQTNLTNNDTGSIVGLGGHAEGAAVSKETRKKVRRLKNCTQIFREPYTITGTQKVTKMYGGMELSRRQARKLKKIKTDVEYAILTRGAIDLDASAENPKRKFQGFGVGNTAGAVQSLNADLNSDLSISYASGTMDQMDELEGVIFGDLVNGGLEKDVYCSNKWLRFLNRLVRDESSHAINTEMGTDIKAGLRVSTYMGAVGTLNFTPHPALVGSLENYALVVDPINFAIRPLNGRDMKLRVDIVHDGSDGQTDEWLIEVGPQISQENTHAILKLT